MYKRRELECRVRETCERNFYPTSSDYDSFMAFREFSNRQRYLNCSMHRLVYIVQSIDIKNLTIFPFSKKVETNYIISLRYRILGPSPKISHFLSSANRSHESQRVYQSPSGDLLGNRSTFDFATDRYYAAFSGIRDICQRTQREPRN